MIGADGACICSPGERLFPVEKAMKMSPEESYPLPPTRARPTVARFARRYDKSSMTNSSILRIDEGEGDSPYQRQ
jgi:hypothetical protein